VSEPFLSEIRMFGFNFAPRGWALCDGQILPINQNQALFSLLGTIYGGDGRTSFALPDLRGRTPVHFGSGFVQGQRSGEEAHTLQTNELPQHTHTASATGDQGSDTNIEGATGEPNNVLASQARRGRPIYSGPAALTLMHPGTVANTGGNQAHNNMQPYRTISFAIAIQGVFPSRN
jgi:microcystin-dependent protein